MSKKVAVSVSLVFAVALVAATVEISNALALRRAIATSPEAERTVEHMGTQYDWKDWMLHHVAPNQLGPVRAWLLESSSSTLRGGQYAIAGLGGGVFAYWLWLLGVRPGDGERMARPLLRILAGGVAGLLVMLVLRLPAPLLARWPALGEGVGAIPKDALLDSCHALAALAGLFLASFVESLRGVFKSK